VEKASGKEPVKWGLLCLKTRVGTAVGKEEKKDCVTRENVDETVGAMKGKWAKDQLIVGRTGQRKPTRYQKPEQKTNSGEKKGAVVW